MSSQNKPIDPPAGNIYDKYHAKNPFHKYLINRFLETLGGFLSPLEEVKTLLEAGCGDGYLLNYVNSHGRFLRIEGMDISEEIIKKAKNSYPALKFSTGSVYDLNYKAGEFDLVLACEVLEHLSDCDRALSEIKRVSKKYCIVSVPLEPLWRITNILRGAYISSLGNTPGHIQHWNKSGFLKMLGKHFIIEKVVYPPPWQMALCKK